MKKVLLVSCEGLGNGGVQAVMMSIVRNLHTKYIFDVLLFTSEKRVYDDEFVTYGGTIYRVPWYEGKNKIRKKIDYYIRDYHMYKSVLDILKNESYDVIHCHNEDESGPIVKAAFETGVPIRIVHTHHVHSKPHLLATVINKIHQKEIERYATIKAGCSQEACDSFFTNKNSTMVINNAYDNYSFNRKRYFLAPHQTIHLLQVGSFSERKNQIFTLEIVCEIKKKYKNVKLTFVGFPLGDYIDKIRAKIEELNLKENVLILPNDADTPALLNESTAFVFPSISEGFGIVLIEAQAMGVRCYASDSIPQTANCGGVQFLSLSDGAKVWADVIMEDYNKYAGMPVNFNVEAFSMENVIQVYDRLYQGELE
jgi:glycosyltransferase involved in cell wall biosynthesis